MTPREFDASASLPRRAAIGAAHHGEAMIIAKHSPRTRRRSHCNGHRIVPPAEPLSARITRLRIARGYSVGDLASRAATAACVIHRLEAGDTADKRVLPALAIALGVPYCRLLCGDHDCAERACVPARAAAPATQPRPLRPDTPRS